MAANDDNPPPPPGLTFEEYKKTIKIDYHKPQETNSFIRLISPFKIENIMHILDKCKLFPSACSDGEIEEEGEVEFPKKDNAVFLDLFDLVETAKENKVVSPPKTSRGDEILPSSSSSQTADCPLVAYSSSPSPNVRSPDVGSPDRAPSLTRKKYKSRKGSSRKSSRSPDSYRRRRSPTARSSHHRSSGSKVRSSSRSHRSSRTGRSYDSRSKSPDDARYRKRDEDRRRLPRSYDSRSKSPDDARYRKRAEDRRRLPRSYDSRSKSPDSGYHRKKEEDRRRRHKSHDSRSKSPDDAYYRKKDEDRRRRGKSIDSRSKSPDDPLYRKKDEDLHKVIRLKSIRLPITKRLSSSPSPDAEDAQKTILTKDTSPKGFPLKFRKFPVDSEDDYSAMLSEEMKKRNLLSDSDEEPDIRVEMDTGAEDRRLAAATEDVSAQGETETLPEDRANLIKYELGMVDEAEKSSDVQFPQDNYFEDVKVKSEFLEDKKYNIPNNYFCDLCQKALNSQVTWESHISGKKHAQKVKLQTVDEIAKGSLAIPKTPAVVSEDIPRFAGAPLGRKRLPLNAIPRLQQTIDEISDIPIPGLDFVQEIISPMDVDYYCELCDAPCKSSSIMPHLIGFKHQLRAVREISPLFYERNKNRQGKQLKSELKSILVQHERRNGRGFIKVFSEIEDPHTRPAYDQPGPSYSNPFPAVKKEVKEGESEGGVEKDRWLDMSKGDFFCTLCDSHMNNVNMWEAHVRGKRHLANAKKIPGENISKMKSEKIPNATSKLEEMIDEEFTDEIVVGLDYIRETRGLNGEIYNCFLCGSCSTNYDILDHILLLKHRTRYLEKLFTDGKTNAIKDIDNLALKDNNYRVALINDECLKMLDEYGRGRVEVYQTKT